MRIKQQEVPNTKSMIKTFADIGYILSSNLIEELHRENGSIVSWLEKIPNHILVRYEKAYEDLNKRKFFLDSKYLTDTEKQDLMCSITLLLNHNNNNNGASTEEIVSSFGKLIPVITTTNMNNDLYDSLGGPLFIITPGRDPWKLLGGGVELNPLYRDRIKKDKDSEEIL